MWYIINANKRKTWILLAFLTLVFLAFGFFAAGFLASDDYSKFQFNGSLIGASISTVCLIGILLYTKFQGSKFFLNCTKAVEVDKHADTVFKNVVEEMAIASALGFVPKSYIIDAKIPNAFAVGINEKNAAIVVTTGLLAMLNRDELQAVVAHETSHIKNQDTLYILYAGVIFGLLLSVGDVLLRAATRSTRSSSKNNAAGAIMIVAIIAFIAAFFARLLYFALSRKREFLADACACQYTRYPLALASALNKISSFEYVNGRKSDIEKDAMAKSSQIVSCMYIHNNLKSEAKNFFTGLFATHPPIKKRIEVLSKMSSADLAEYMEKYSSIVSNKELIPKKVVEKMNITPLAVVASVVKEETKNERISRQREAKDEYKKAACYRVITCECETILKLPREYSKETITCPHCKKVHKLK